MKHLVSLEVNLLGTMRLIRDELHQLYVRLDGIDDSLRCADVDIDNLQSSQEAVGAWFNDLSARADAIERDLARLLPAARLIPHDTYVRDRDDPMG